MAAFETAATLACDHVRRATEHAAQTEGLSDSSLLSPSKLEALQRDAWPGSLGEYSEFECGRRLPPPNMLGSGSSWSWFSETLVTYVIVAAIVLGILACVVMDHRAKQEELAQEQGARDVLRRLDDVLGQPMPEDPEPVENMENSADEADGEASATEDRLRPEAVSGEQDRDRLLAEEQVSGPRGGVCPICLEEGLKDATGEHEPMVLPCGHVFHKDCIGMWSREQEEGHRDAACPICRAPYHQGRGERGEGEGDEDEDEEADSDHGGDEDGDGNDG